MVQKLGELWNVYKVYNIDIEAATVSRSVN